MRLTSILSEAWRNTTSGASHALLLTALGTLLLGGLATAETLTVNALTARTAEHIAAGGDITVITTTPAPDGTHALNGTACEALAQLPGITAAGALRNTDTTLTLAALPSNPFTVAEASPGLRDILNVDGTPATPGVWLTDTVAAATGAHAQSTLATTASSIPVSGIFDYPNDGRPAQLSNTVFAPVNADNTFDQCWIRAWPTPTGLPELANSLLDAGADPATTVTTTRLNTSLAANFDGATQFAHRITALAAPTAFAAGIILGLAAIRARRRELAYHRHIGVPRTAQALQTLTEALAWIVAATMLAAAVTAALASPDAFAATWQLALRVLALGAASCLLGSLVGLMTVRESSLFRYVKE